jgi:hypothetical protein
MSTDITSKVQEITVINSVDDNEAGGSVVLAGTNYVDDGTIAVDKQFYVSFEYSPNAPALNLRGVVSDIQKKDSPRGDKETVVTLMSPFKNYRKQILNTTYFPDGTAIKDVLELLAGTYMGLPAGAYDFTLCYWTLNKFRIDGLTIPDAMTKLMQVGAVDVELVWVNGVLTAVGAGADVHSYPKNRLSVIDREGNTDINVLTSLNVIGAEMTPHTAPVAETIGTLAIPAGELTEGIDRWYFYVELTKLPAISITVESDLTTYFDFSYEGLKGNYAIILATRTGAGAQGATNLTVKGRPFKIGKLQQKVVLPAVFAEYSSDMEADYENPFIQSIANIQAVGTSILTRNWYSVRRPTTIKAPYDGELKPNDNIEVMDGGALLSTHWVRTIKTTWRASDSVLESVIDGWEII